MDEAYAPSRPMTTSNPPPQARAGAALFAGIGIALTGTYAVASAYIPLWRYFPGPGFSLGFPQLQGVPLPQAPDAQWEDSAIEYAGLVVVTFSLYAIALLLVRRRASLPRWLLFGFPVLFALALMPMYPPTAADMFHYHAMARVFWVFSANPLTTPASTFPYPIDISWEFLASPYGPLWSLLTLPAARLPGEHMLAGLLAFKTMAAVSYLGCAWVVWRLVGRIRPGHEAFALVLFAWNPFVVLRVVGNGHNDLWMMLFALLALERAERRAWTSSVALLTLSVLVKFSSALLGPPLLLYMWTHAGGSVTSRLGLFARCGAVAVAVAAWAYSPFWAGADTFDNLSQQASMMITSTPQLIELWLRSRMVDQLAATDIARQVSFVLFGALYFPLTWQARKGFEGLVAACFGVLFAYLLVAAGWFRPWYLLWPVSILALRPGRRWALLLLTITFFGAFPDLVEQYRDHWPRIDTWAKFIAAPIVVAFLAPALLWLVALVAEARGLHSTPRAAYGASVQRGETAFAAGREASDMTQDTDGNAPGIPQLDGPIEELESGLRYIDEVVGDGATPSRGQQVIVHYSGWLTDGSAFDSSVGRGPFDFAIGTGMVIRGWDEGVASMQVGGRRRIIVPSALGYGQRGAPPVIPPDATLIFDVELLALG